MIFNPMPDNSREIIDSKCRLKMNCYLKSDLQIAKLKLKNEIKLTMLLSQKFLIDSNFLMQGQLNNFVKWILNIKFLTNCYKNRRC